MIFSEEILHWYAANKRDLPWRQNKNPYQIWLSEIILQQTRVAQGLPYYIKFTERFPDVVSFANANIDEILLLWQGLGYYSRGRNMHYAANQIVKEFNGEFPNNFNDLKKLKGVGDYTAAAIASIAYNRKEAVVDGNVYRVLSRYFNESTPIDSSDGKKLFNKLANELVCEENPGDYNQALMELGALICTPKNPSCAVCPVNSACGVAFSKKIEILPVKSKKIKVTERYFNYFHVLFNDKIVLEKRGENDIWQGLHQFPLIEGNDIGFNDFLADLVGEKQTFELNKVATFKHILTHQRIFVDFYKIEISSMNRLKAPYFVVDKGGLDNYAMPKLMVNYLNSIN